MRYQPSSTSTQGTTTTHKATDQRIIFIVGNDREISIKNSLCKKMGTSLVVLLLLTAAAAGLVLPAVEEFFVVMVMGAMKEDR